jgi:mono/diheme cytochrome c family protein
MPPSSSLLAAAAVLVVSATAATAAAAEPGARAPADPDALPRRFAEQVRPFLATYCLGCHGHDKPRGQLDLSVFSDLASVTRDLRRWEPVLEMLESGEMPPAKARQPAPAARAQVQAFIRDVRQHEAARTAGDPGPVLARRLSNAEYDYTVRDLTGVDIRPTREFPVDPANEAGFDNSGESLTMSPALLDKYLGAARAVAEHLVLAPRGFRFAAHPAVTDTDRDRHAVERIVSFYQRQPTDLAAYFLAAWRYQHRRALGLPDATLASSAAREKVQARYLNEVWTALNTPETLGPLARVQAMFRALPAPPDEAAARAGSQRLRDYVTGLRPKLSPTVPNMKLKTVGAGSQPFVLWKNSQRAAQRSAFDPAVLYVPQPPTAQLRPESIKAAAGLLMAVVHFGFRNIVHDSALPIPFGVHELAETFAPPDPELAIPDEAARPRHAAAFARFCRVFPDAFYVAQRGRAFLDQPRDRKQKEETGRLLSAGFHNSFGFFRDDRELYRRILDDAGRRELDGLWRELDFITRAPVRQHADFIFYERAEGTHPLRDPAFDFVRSEDKSSGSPAMIRRLATVYLAKARESLQRDGGDPRAIGVLEAFFRSVSDGVQRVERERRAAEPSHLAALLEFAGRAYRRPLTAAERTGLVSFYRSLRAQGLEHEDAIRDGVARVLMSPAFIYLNADRVAGSGVRALDDRALASRLSYFLWSSAPDAELLAQAARRDLHRPAVLAAQARRMLRDPRARALAVEFGGQWLDFRRFEEHNAVDRKTFPSFDDQLRQAMFEEPVRFFVDLLQADGSVLDFLFADHTFVNAPLARHYGMPVPAATPGSDSDGWTRVDGAGRYQRGGLLPMAVFLTRNAPGLRTSPVKRGYWVVRRVLGEVIPPPPAQVPELPRDERQLGQLTLREVLAQHRDNPACAGCHARFDAFGLAFEGYGPVGEARTVDLGGRPVDARAAFPLRRGDGAARPATEDVHGDGSGLAHLRAHLRAHRQDDFLDNLCRKLLAYALGRGLQPSDESTLDTMRETLAAQGHRFGALVDTIVKSPQFLHKRGGDYSLGSLN